MKKTVGIPTPFVLKSSTSFLWALLSSLGLVKCQEQGRVILTMTADFTASFISLDCNTSVNYFHLTLVRRSWSPFDRQFYCKKIPFFTAILLLYREKLFTFKLINNRNNYRQQIIILTKSTHTSTPKQAY